MFATGRTHTPVFPLLWCGLRFFAIDRLIHGKFRLLGWRGGVWDPKTEYFCFRDFYEIFSVCEKFHVRLTIKIWGFAKGFLELWGLTPKFSAHPSGETILRIRPCFKGAKIYGLPLSLCWVWTSLAAWAKKVWCFCLFCSSLIYKWRFWKVEIMLTTLTRRRRSAPTGVQNRGGVGSDGRLSPNISLYL